MSGTDAQVVVRTARPAEHAAAGAVTQAAWREFERADDPLWRDYYERLGDVDARAERGVVLVALAGGQVVGTATVELGTTLEDGGALAPEQANLRMLAVEPQWRGRGIGRQLVEACLGVARAGGKRLATLHTTEEMTAAAHLYRTLGFEREPAADVTLAPELTLRAYRLELRG